MYGQAPKRNSNDAGQNPYNQMGKKSEIPRAPSAMSNRLYAE